MSKYRKTLPEGAIKYVPVEVPPGSYLIKNSDFSGESLIHTRYWITVMEPMILWERWINEPVEGKEKWTRGRHGSTDAAPPTYTIPTWWRRLWRHVEEPAVPHARVITR